TGPPAPRGRRSAQAPASAGAGEPGSKLSITDPYNCIPIGFKAIRYGIDSLYLSYSGKLNPDWKQKLHDLKLKAQSEEEAEQALAQAQIGSHIFDVKGRGVPLFPFVLVDNCFHIQLSSGKSEALPMAYVQVSSEYLSAAGPEQAEADLRFVLNTLGLVKGLASLSRCDPHLDFVCDIPLDQFNESDWIYRAHVFSKYWHRRVLSGFSIGLGGNLSARLYDKTLEVETKSFKFYLHDLWAQAGRKPDQKVYRMEFQVRRAVLKELGINTLPELLEALPRLWKYLTEDWLRLTIPNPSDQTQTRWPNHPLWDAISSVYSVSLDQPRLKRFKPARLPFEDRLYEQGVGQVSSFMAARGIEDWGEGIGEYLAHAKLHFDMKERRTKGGFYSYLERKLRAKGRSYNTIKNKAKDGSEEAELAKQVAAYLKAKDGE
ncbi:MAG: hypothetical protein ACRD2L_06035, partial [Terriglobia bacterium]